MKKIISLALVMILAFALAIPAFADTTPVNGAASGSPTTFAPQESDSKVNYTMNGFYTVTIPASLDMSDETKTANDSVTVTKLMLGYGQTLKVELQYDGELVLTVDESEVDTIDYSISFDDGEGAENITKNTKTEILTVKSDTGYASYDAGTPKSSSLVATLGGNAEFAGIYTGTVTFFTSVATN